MMEDVYKSINRITKTDAYTKAYHEPRYGTISEVANEEVNKIYSSRDENKICMSNPMTALVSKTNKTAGNTIEIKGTHVPTELQSN